MPLAGHHVRWNRAMAALMGIGAAWAAPVIEFSTREYDFGRLEAGRAIQHDFTFTNKGDAKLSVTHVLTSCGCLTSTNWSRDIAPGQQGRVPFSFNSTGMAGEFYRTLTVSTNDPAQPSIMLTIKGVVWQKIQITPATAQLTVQPPSLQRASGSVSIVNHTNVPLKLQAPVSQSPQLSARVEEIKPGKEFRVHIETVPPVSTKIIRGLIVIGTNSPETPVLNIPVSAVLDAAPVPAQ
jgi:hypothetical protein